MNSNSFAVEPSYTKAYHLLMFISWTDAISLLTQTELFLDKEKPFFLVLHRELCLY